MNDEQLHEEVKSLYETKFMLMPWGFSMNQRSISMEEFKELYKSIFQRGYNVGYADADLRAAELAAGEDI